MAYWEYDYLNGATDSDNLVRMSDSTWTNILQPAAAAVVQKVAALPLVNGCVPGQLVSYFVCSRATSLHFVSQLYKAPQDTSTLLCSAKHASDTICLMTVFP